MAKGKKEAVGEILPQENIEEVNESLPQVNKDIIIIPPFKIGNGETFIKLSNKNVISIKIINDEGIIPYGHVDMEEIISKLESEKWRIK